MSNVDNSCLRYDQNDNSAFKKKLFQSLPALHENCRHMDYGQFSCRLRRSNDKVWLAEYRAVWCSG